MYKFIVGIFTGISCALRLVLLYFSWNWFLSSFFHVGQISLLGALLGYFIITYLSLDVGTYTGFQEKDKGEQLETCIGIILMQLTGLGVLYAIRFWIM